MKRWLAVVLFLAGTAYFAIGHPLLGYRVCFTKGMIMSELDRVQQLSDYVHEIADRKRAADKSFNPDPVIMNAALDAFRECVDRVGFDGCKKGIELRIGETDVLFGYSDKMFGGVGAGASFTMGATGEKGFKEFGAYNFHPLGCWFTGIED